MINWKELEKFIAPGKIVTLVVMVDGTEIGAFSFNVDSLAYKSVLETITEEAKPAVKIADKAAASKEIKDAEAERKANVAKKKEDKKASKPAVTVKKEEPVVQDEIDDLPFGDDEDPIVADEETGEVIEQKEEKPIVTAPAEPERKLTRAEIMAMDNQPDVSTEVKTHVAETNKTVEQPKPVVEEKKVVEPTFGEEW